MPSGGRLLTLQPIVTLPSFSLLDLLWLPAGEGVREWGAGEGSMGNSEILGNAANVIALKQRVMN